MIDSDGKENLDIVTAEESGDVTVQDTPVDGLGEESKDAATEEVTDTEAPEDSEASKDVAPNKTNTNFKADVAENDAAENSEKGGVGEIVGFSIKVVAIALSVVFLLLSIFTVAMPFSAMKVFNNLGMYERALESGDRYINGEISAFGAGREDEYGNFKGVTETPALTNDDFVEALDVCINLSNKLMTESKAVKSTADEAYYAEKLERYTRIYACLAGVGSLNAKKNSANIANVPMIQLRPYVYSYAHTIMKLNFSARVVLGKTDYMMYSIGRAGDVMTSVDERLNTLTNTVEKSGLIDQYVDFIDELNAYLEYELDKLGLTGIELNETTVRTKYSKVLDGSQFSLFIVPLDGFTRLYNGLGETFTTYAQLAYDYEPSTMDDRLHQLYQLQVLTSFSEKMSDISTLLYYNADAYGASSSAIIHDYPNWDKRRAVFDGQQNRVLIELYGILMDRYVSIIHS